MRKWKTTSWKGPPLYVRRRRAFPDGIEVESNCVGRGTTAPEMMLLPYMSEPDGFTDAIDVHRWSGDECHDETDGCATELESSVRRTNRHRGRLLVEVTHSQKLSHEDLIVVLKERCAIVNTKKSKTIREMVELLFPLTLREDMKDVFILPRGLGLRGVGSVRKS